MAANSNRQKRYFHWWMFGLGSYFLAFIVARSFPYAEPAWLLMFRKWLLPALLFTLFVYFIFFHRWKGSKRTGFETNWDGLKGKTLEKVKAALSLIVGVPLFCWFVSVSFMGVPVVLTKMFSYEEFLAHAKVVNREKGELSRFTRTVSIINLETNSESSFQLSSISDWNEFLNVGDEVCIIGKKWILGASIENVRSGDCVPLTGRSTPTAVSAAG